jgi:hypothetical protein
MHAFGNKLIISVLFLIVYTSNAFAMDLEIGHIQIYGHYRGKKGEYIYQGENAYPLENDKDLKLEVFKFDEVEGANADFIDVMTKVKNRSTAVTNDIDIRLTVSPKIALLSYHKELPDALDIDKVKKNSKWFNSFIIVEKHISKIDAGQSTNVVFKEIKLKEILYKYFEKGMWLTDLLFEIAIEPHNKEENIDNNLVKRNLVIPVPVY